MDSRVIRLRNLEACRLADGTIRLRQQSRLDEPSVIDLDPSQFEHLARVFGIGRERDLERRLSVLADRLQDVVCDSYFRTDILERCGDGLFLIAKLDSVVDLAVEFDGGRLQPADPADLGKNQARSNSGTEMQGEVSERNRTQPNAPPGQIGLGL